MGHFIKECEKLLAEMRQQILDEKEQDQKDSEHQKQDQTTAVTARRSTAQGRAWGASYNAREKVFN